MSLQLVKLHFFSAFDISWKFDVNLFNMFIKMKNNFIIIIFVDWMKAGECIL